MTEKQAPPGVEGSGSPKPGNRLAGEKSPYLLQHAHNPVDWHPWGEEAFGRAREQNKMVLISIGYATCHWCHVMERESFEDEELAKYLNEHFVAIKVDREERPDVDKIYMDSLHAMGQQGGWPLNMFTTPDGRPVTGGTYFPPQEMQGRPSFRQVLEMLVNAWEQQREDIYKNADLITEHLQQQARLPGASGLTWSHEPIENAVGQYSQAYDRAHGGFLLQPQNKFPPSMGLLLLLRHHVRTEEATEKATEKVSDHTALEMVEGTLKKMVAGGIYDQLGGGLSRYSTDPQWLVPHFEKMLYDNALFAQALTETYQVTGKPIYRAYAEDVFAYVLRDLSGEEGAFYSAEDADSEGEEGLFYVWEPEEVRALLKPGAAGTADAAAVADAAIAWWDLRPGGNFEHGRSIPNTPRTLGEVARSLDISMDELVERLQVARDTLLAARSQRIRPLRDDKILTSWNALMISALARAGAAFGDDAYIAVALKAGRFLLENLKDGKARLLRRYREGEARYKGYLIDYATLAVACLDLYEATFEQEWFAEALYLMREVNRLFRNEEGPYFDTGNDAEQLLARNMEGYDGVEPSGNSMAAQAFLRLEVYGVSEGFGEDARRIFSGFHQHLEQAGVGFSAMLSALDFFLSPVQEVAIIGDPAAADTQALLKMVRGKYRPNSVLTFSSPDMLEENAALIPLLRGREAIEGRATAYVCENMACQLPVHTPEELAEQLD